MRVVLFKCSFLCSLLCALCRHSPKRQRAYNGHDPKHSYPVGNVAGVFAGWTASDLIADCADAASLAYSIYGTTEMLPQKLMELMIPNATEYYALATFNLTHTTGLVRPEGTAYGHLGSTYGFESIVAYFPRYNFSLSIASNIETDVEPLTFAAMCRAFNFARAVIEGRPVPTCNTTAATTPASDSDHLYTHGERGRRGSACRCSDMPPTPPPTPLPPSPYGPSCNGYQTVNATCYLGPTIAVKSTGSVAGCCQLASAVAKAHIFNFHTNNGSCELFDAFHDVQPCPSGLLGYEGG